MSQRTCSVNGCDRPTKARGYCSKHYQQQAVAYRVSQRTCSIEGCNSPHRSRGYCNSHYLRLRKRGTPELAPKPSLEERFWAKVDKTGGCWLWTGTQGSNGYGNFQDRTQKRGPAHRWAYEFAVGPIAEGLVLDHLCRNPACVRPDHLEPVTYKENSRRGLSTGIRVHITHCPQGHPYAGDNLIVAMRKTGPARVCRQCKNADGRRHYWARKSS